MLTPSRSNELIDRRDFLKNSVLAAAALGSQLDLPSSFAQVSPSRRFDLEEATIEDLSRNMQPGHLAHQITQQYLDRVATIDQAGPSLRAVIEINPDAIEIAKQLDAERLAGKIRGPLHGIPVLIKDNVSTADKMQTTAGSLALVGAGSPHQQDSFVAAQLRKAGAVILGKTNLSEWANFRSDNSSSGWSGRGGQTHCPYALDRNPSGSSSGSGAAVSANLCAVAVGTETDGSIVSPACSNGIVGIKPTVGLVSRAGIVPISHTQDTAGPMARTVADAAALLTALAGVDPNDPATAAAQGHITDYTKSLDSDGLRGMRLGVVRQYAGFSIAVDKVFADALLAMQRAGAVIVDPVEIATFHKWSAAEGLVLHYEFKADLNQYLAALGTGAKVRSLADVIAFNNTRSAQEMPYFGQDIFIKAQAKGGLDTEEYKKALADCGRLTRAEGIDATMDKHKLDALVCPTGTPAWVTDLVNGDANEPSSSSLAAVAGYPHITVPMGFIFGLPVGVSFFGRAWSEPILIKAAYGFEQKTKHRRPPQFLTTADLKPESNGL